MIGITLEWQLQKLSIQFDHLFEIMRIAFDDLVHPTNILVMQVTHDVHLILFRPAGNQILSPALNQQTNLLHFELLFLSDWLVAQKSGVVRNVQIESI